MGLTASTEEEEVVFKLGLCATAQKFDNSRSLIEACLQQKCSDGWSMVWFGKFDERRLRTLKGEEG